MDARQRSPSYPSTSLGEAIDIIKKLHNVERTNPVDREVAAKAIGYTGITGRSATILSNLLQFGLLDKVAKNEVRVSQRAIDILYPDSDSAKAHALKSAANEPDLFRAISDRFTDGYPSAAALEAFLIRQGFTHTAIGPATKAYMETFAFLGNETGSDSYLEPGATVLESQPNQLVEKVKSMSLTVQPQRVLESQKVSEPKPPVPTEGYDVRIWQKTIWLGGTIRSRGEADELIATINALKPMLPNPEATPNAKKMSDILDEEQGD